MPYAPPHCPSLPPALALAFNLSRTKLRTSCSNALNNSQIAFTESHIQCDQHFLCGYIPVLNQYAAGYDTGPETSAALHERAA